ncbi:kinesin-like protein KIN-14K isoform X1 [Impatiens glandulifera]|uniref:kinesin-like protein KIN-14K isoform X1 n=1 Tax=Impatiens glandulifera TaxID=253017 RepID=UPI001FB09D73|nr:kinesin-like protein KIN-14K isoform X1 [Impatiens glandulifera]
MDYQGKEYDRLSSSSYSSDVFEPTMNRIAEAEAKQRTVVIEWINNIIPGQYLPINATNEELRNFLSDGTVLCRILNRLRPGCVVEGGSSGSSLDSRHENINRFLAAMDAMRLPRFKLFDLEKGSMKHVLECLLTLKAQFMPNSGTHIAGSNLKTGNDASTRWKLLAQCCGGKEGTGEQLSPKLCSPSASGDERRRGIYDSKVRRALRSPVVSEPSAALMHHVGHKFHEVFQLNQGSYVDLSPSKISEIMKSNSLDNAPTQSLLSVANGILNESNERKNGEMPHRVAGLLRKVIQEIERRISAQAEHIKTQNNLFKAREEKYQSRISVLEALAAGTGEETQVQTVSRNAPQQAKDTCFTSKVEMKEMEEKKKLEELDVIRLLKEKEQITKEVLALTKEKEHISQENFALAKELDVIKLVKEKDQISQKNMVLTKELDVVRLVNEKEQISHEVLELTKEKEKISLENLTLTKEKIQVSQENLALTIEKEKISQENLALTKDKEQISRENLALAKELDVVRLAKEKEHGSAEVLALTKEKEHISTEILALSNERDVVRLGKEKEHISEDVLALTKEKERISEEVLALTKKKELGNAEILKLTIEKEHISTEISALSKELDVVKLGKGKDLTSEEVLALTKEKELISAEVLKLTKEKEHNSAEILKLTKEKERISTEILSLSKELDAVKSGKEKDSTSGELTLTREKELISEEVLALKKEKEHISQEKLALVKEKEKSDQEILALKQDLEKARNTNQQYSVEIKNEAKGAQQELEEKLKNAEHAKQELEERLKKTESAKQELEERWKEAEGSKKDVEERTKGSNLELEKRLEETKASKQEFEEMLKKAESAKQELEGRLKKSESAKQELEGKLKDSEGSKKDVEERTKGSNQELEERLKETKASKQEFEEMLKKAESAKQELEERLKEAEERTKGSKQELDERLKESKASKQEVEERLKKAEGAKKELEERLKEVEGAKKVLEERLSETKASKQELEERLKETNASKQELEERLNETKASKQELEDRLNETKASKQELEEKLKETKTSKEELEEKLKETKASKEELEEKLKETKASKEELEERLKETKTAKQELEEKLRENTNLLSESRKRINEVEAYSESRDQQWKKKQHISQILTEFQIGVLRDIKCASVTIKQDLSTTQNTYTEEFLRLGKTVKVLIDASQNYHAVLADNRKLHNEVQELKGNIRVYCRVRPFIPGQKAKDSIVDYVGEFGELGVLNPAKPGKDGQRVFKFNKVYSTDATQVQVYSDIQPLIRSVLDGFNVCIFAYGQTGSGKTYTMTGPDGASEADRGVNYRSLDDLFQISQTRNTSFSYEIGVQMVEIYNEQVRDLLSNDAGSKNLAVLSTPQANGLAVPDASMHIVKAANNVLEFMQTGLNNRAKSATSMNERSSRSHSILSIHSRGTDLKSGSLLRGSLHLVDLAGSERIDRSEATGDRLKEAQHINKSLAALGDVIFALAQKSAHVPYRNSKLTQVLQSSLGGHAKTLMFVQLNPEGISYTESMSTLKFAERVSGVELGGAKSTKDGKDVKELMDQITSLKLTISKKDEEIARLGVGKDKASARSK